MTENFNFKRALLLFRSILITYKLGCKRLLFIVIGALSLAFGWDTFMENPNPFDYVTTTIGYTYIVLVGVAYNLMYSQYREKLHLSTSHMLPASINEKFFVPFFITLILLPLLFLLLLAVMVSIFWVITLLMALDSGVGLDMDNLSIVINNLRFSYLDTLKMTLLVDQIDGTSGMPVIFRYFYIHPVLSLSTTLTKRYVWNPTCIWIGLSILYVMLETSNCFDSLAHGEYIWSAIMLLLTLTFWVASYYKFKKVQLYK